MWPSQGFGFDIFAKNILHMLVLWDTAEERYAEQFVDNEHPAHPCRVAIGALLIQRRLKCSDEWVVKHIGEKKPRMYRRCARRDSLQLSKSKKRSAKTIRSAVQKQLQYIRRDVGYIV